MDRKEYFKEWRRGRDKAKDLERVKLWQVNNRERYLKQHREHVAERRAANPEVYRAALKRSGVKVRREIFAHYGERCACCGEATKVFLTIDHIDGGGNAHRKSLKKTAGTSFYFWLRKQGFPEGIQTLCHNCNWAKVWNDVCPHQMPLPVERIAA